MLAELALFKSLPDVIDADGDARAVGIALLWADLANHFSVSDYFSVVGGDIFEAN